MVYMLSKILLLVFGSHNLSQAEKKITVVTSWATHKMTLIFTPNNKFSLRTILCDLIQLLSYFSISFRCKSQQQNFRQHVDHLTLSSENSSLFSYLPRLEPEPKRIYNPITAMTFSAMSTNQLDMTKRQTLPAPHCRIGSCRYVWARPLFGLQK